MAERRPIMAGNWKMHHTHLEAIQVVQKLSYPLDEQDYEACEVVVCPAFTALRSIQTVLEGDRIPIALGAQDVHWKEQGAFTGEVSPIMLAKLNAVLKHGMAPIVCVGETLDEREAGRTDAKVSGQVQAAFAGVRGEDPVRCVVAYEPIWAIGTGRNATPEDASATIAVIRQTLRELYKGAADEIRIQYGGSVKPGNIAELMVMPEIDGALVGGASLDPVDFSRVIKYRA